MSSSSVLLVSLGPVQAFIASGRRCRDLWYGSSLLSDLAAAAAKAIADDIGDEALVFPSGAVRGMLGRASVANRVLARVPGDLQRAEAVARGAKQAVDACLRDLAVEAFERVGKGDAARDRNFHQQVALEQVEDLIEVQWAAVEEVDGYDAARKAADTLLAQRKNTRVWAQPTWDTRGGVPKSALDGALESVLDEALYGSGGLSPDELYRRYRARPSERLSGVDLLKRFGRRAGDEDWDQGGRWEERFFSTSHVAALPWMTGLAESGDASAEAAFQAYADVLRAEFKHVAKADLNVAPAPSGWFGCADGGLFFEGRITDLAEEAGAEPTQLAKAKHKLRELVKRGRKLGCGEPEPYYAVLVADGDRMGKLIDRLSGHEQHRKLSEALVDFADQARDTVESHQGSTIYAGGDDVMAFVPLHRALACAQKLHGDFETAVGQIAESVNVPSALSVGVAVAHHLSPLDETLALARRAEALAKKKRDSLAVIVDKRGGATLEVSGGWRGDHGETGAPLHGRLARFVTAHLEDEISDKTAFELEALRWVQDMAEADKMQGVLTAEVERILARKRGKRGRTPLERQWLEEAGLDHDPVRLGRELIVARVFAKAERQARPTPPSSTASEELRA